MSMKTKFISLFVALLATTALWAYDFKSGDLYYEIMGDNTVKVTSHSDYEMLTSVNIPASVTYNSTTYNVTSIDWLAFSGCTGLTSITIPNSVTDIGMYAFHGCIGLTSITIPCSATHVGEGSFAGCTGLTSVIWNAKKCTEYNTAVNGVIITLGLNPFSCYYDEDSIAYLTNIESFTFGNEVEFIPRELCRGMNKLTTVTIPNSVTGIGYGAFRDCSSLTSVTIPNSVTSIGSSAFSDCISLTSIIIPNSVTRMEWGAFIGCTGLASIIVESGNTTYDSRDNCNAIIETATNTLKYSCKATIIPNSVTSIGYGAFGSCTGLTSVTIPNSVTSIGSSAFSGCTGLASVAIPNSVTSIEASTFYGCTGLTSVVIGNNNELDIDAYAFDDCENLTSVTCYANVPPIIIFDEYEGEKDGAFDAERLSKMRLYVPAEAISRYKEAEEWKDFGRIASIGATTIDTDDEQPIVQPSFTDVTITWKITPNAETYTIAITRGTETVCTLAFNADGQLTNIAFAAPSRNGTPHHAPAAVMTEQGYQFTVTGLESGTQYDYTLSVKDNSGKELQNYAGTFTTQGEGTAIDNLSAGNTTTQPKVIHNGQMYIRRGDKMYTVKGMEVK